MLWFTSSIETDSFLPTKEFFIDYDGSKFLIRPETNELHSTISVEFETFHQKDDHKIAHEKLKKFLSIFCYYYDCGITELTWYSSPEPMKIGKTDTIHVNESFRLKELPIVTNEKVLLALALYREAKSTNNIMYRFLGFFKIINIKYENGNCQIDWINDHLQYLKFEKSRIKEIKEYEENIGKYLYKQCRCAIGVPPLFWTKN